MARLLVIAVSLCIVGSLATGAAIQIGRFQSAPTGLSMLHLTDCSLPCWIGRTSRIGARERILDVFARTYGFRVIRDTYSEALNLANISLQAPGEPVQILDFTLATGLGLTVDHIVIRSSARITVAELHNLLGSPTYVLASRALPSLVYGDGVRGLRVAITKGSPLSPADLVVQIDLFADASRTQDFAPWRGFTRLSRYARP